MASYVEIANQALTILGADTITAPNEVSTEAKRIAAIYEPTRNELLQDHPWNFAKKRAILSPLATAPVFEWSYAFQLPNDYLRILYHYPKDTEYKIEGSTILANTNIFNIRYIAKITDESLFPNKFSEAFAAKLAYKLAYAITSSATMTANMKDHYEQVLKSARQQNAIEGTPENIDDYGYIWDEARVI